MIIAAVILAIVTSVMLVISGIGKLVQQSSQMTTLETVGFPAERVPILAVLEFAAAAGLIVGLAWWPVGIAAGVGAILYFAGAIAAHLRKRDREVGGAAMMLALAVATLAVRVLSP